MKRPAVGLVTPAVITAVMAGTVAATGAPAAAKPAARPTVVTALSPLDDANQLAAGYTIQHRYSDASCESGSPTVGKAYQCFTPQSTVGIYSSCWVQANTDYVICLVKPWQHKVVRLHVNRGYGDSGGFPTVTLPWGLRLGDGTRCLVILGPVHVTRGKPINYYCPHQEALAGKPDRSASSWRIAAYRKVRHRGITSYKSLGRQPVAIAWFGKPSQRDRARDRTRRLG